MKRSIQDLGVLFPGTIVAHERGFVGVVSRKGLVSEWWVWVLKETHGLWEEDRVRVRDCQVLAEPEEWVR